MDGVGQVIYQLFSTQGKRQICVPAMAMKKKMGSNLPAVVVADNHQALIENIYNKVLSK